jgi:hypothetical protein
MSVTPPAIPLLDLAAQNGPLATELRAAFERVLASQAFILGAEVEQFELEIARATWVSSTPSVSPAAPTRCCSR